MFLNNVLNVNIQPAEEIKKNLKKEAEFRLQRAQRGYADADLWNFETYLANVLCEGLEQFRQSTCCYPTETMKEWEQTLLDMQDGFCYYVEHRDDMPSIEDYQAHQDEVNKRLKKSLKLLRKHFQSLWW